MFGFPRKDESQKRRQSARLEVNSVAIVSWLEGEDARQVSGRCLDISEGGARIETTELVAPGTRVTVQFPDLKAGARGVVRHSESGSLGLEFSWLHYFGPHHQQKAAPSYRVPDFYVAAAVVVVLVLVLLYAVPGLLPEWVPFSPRRARPVSLTPISFTLGSSKADVYAIQGPPMRMTDTIWHYGSSRVFFRGEAVSGWSVSPDAPLHTGVGMPDVSAGERKRFGIGSTVTEVMAAQGTPTELTDEVWRYGSSVVYFKNGRVVKWKETSDVPLNAESGGLARELPPSAKKETEGRRQPKSP